MPYHPIMFKTRKPTAQLTTIANPRIDFDYSEFTKAAKLLLGKAKADELLAPVFKKAEKANNLQTEPPKDVQNRNEKEFLILLTHMEYAARYYRENPQEEALWEPTEKDEKADEQDVPYYVPHRTARGKDPRTLRNHYVHEFLQAVSLRTEKSFRLNFPLRIRSEAQHNALSTNYTEIVRDEKSKNTENEYKLRIHISLADLPRIGSNLLHGDNFFSLKISKNSQVPQNPMPIEIVWDDELPHRPEMARQLFGRQTDNLFENGRSSLHKMGQTERGARIHILGGNNCRGTFEKIKDGELQIQLDPQVEIKTGLEPLENEVALMGYLNEQYACSPQEFFDAIPNITSALEKNLEKSTRLWLNIPNNEEISNEEKTQFLQEYNETCLTLQSLPTPIGSLSLNRMPEWKTIKENPEKQEKGSFERAKNSKDLLLAVKTSLSSKESFAPIIDSPFENSISRIEEETMGELRPPQSKEDKEKGIKEPPKPTEKSFSTVSSVNPAASISKDWMENLLQAAIAQANPNPYTDPTTNERVIRSLESVASSLQISPEELRSRRQLILENFYGIGKGRDLDAPDFEKASFMGYSLSEEERERFYQELDFFNQKDFESKGDKPLGIDGIEIAKPDLAEFIRQNRTVESETETGKKRTIQSNTVEVNIPLSPICLHRMTRYPSGLRYNGKDVVRYPYGHPKHLPRDRNGQKNNAVQELKLKDFLSPEGLKDFEKTQMDANATTRAHVVKITNMLDSWNKGYGLILPNKPSNPIDVRAVQWLSGLLRSKKEGGGHEEHKCNSFMEIYTLLTTLSRIAGMKVGGVDTPLQTQPLPSISSAIPLQLLCGVNPSEIKELKTVHESPLELRDLEARWENALKADIYQEADLSIENNDLEEILDTDETTQMIKNIEAVLQTPENHLQTFQEMLEIPQGINNLPKELKPFRPIIPLLQTSPLTIKIEGEEMNLSALLDIISTRIDPNSKIQKEFLSISQQEQNRIENSVQTRALRFKNSLEDAAQKITLLSKESDPLKPKGQKIETILLPEEDTTLEDIENVSSGLSDALLAVETESQRTGKTEEIWTKILAKAITNPSASTILIGNQQMITIHKNPQGELSFQTHPTDFPDEPSQSLLLVTEVVKALERKENSLSPDALHAIEETLTEAKSQEILENSKEILSTIKSIPEFTAKNGGFEKEFEEAKTRLDLVVQLDNIQKALDFQIKNWGYFEETQSGPIESAQIMFDFQREMEILTNKAFGSFNSPEITSLKTGFLEKYTPEARKIYLSKGENNTRGYLRKKGEEFFTEKKAIASKASSTLLKSITNGLQAISSEITPKGKVKETSKNETLKHAINDENGLFRKICNFIETNRVFCAKIQKAERQTEEKQKATPKDKPKPINILPPSLQKGLSSPSKFTIENGKILTNKIWIKDILESKKGQEKFLLGKIASQWAAQGKTPEKRQERAALLIYFKTKGIQKEAILASKTKLGKKALNEIADMWSQKLETLHIPTTGKINPLLAAVATFQQISPEELFQKDLVEILKTTPKRKIKETILPVELKFDSFEKDAPKVISPYINNEDFDAARRSLNKKSYEDSKGTQVKQIRGAAEALHNKEAEEIGR